MTLHEVWADFAAELAHLFARFHAHPVVVQAVAAQVTAASAAEPAAQAAPAASQPTTAAAPAVAAPALAASTAVFSGGGTQTETTGTAAPARKDNPDHVLHIYGEHYVLDGGPTTWPVPNVEVGMNFGVEIAGMNGASHLTIKRPDGTVAHRPAAGGIDIGSADLEFPNGGGQMYVVADQPGTWTAEVRNDDPGVISSIELLDPK